MAGYRAPRMQHVRHEPRRVNALGKVSIRVRDLDAMQKFYEEVAGLEVAAHRGLC